MNRKDTLIIKLLNEVEAQEATIEYYRDKIRGLEEKTKEKK